MTDIDKIASEGVEIAGRARARGVDLEAHLKSNGDPGSYSASMRNDDLASLCSAVLERGAEVERLRPEHVNAETMRLALTAIRNVASDGSGKLDGIANIARAALEVAALSRRDEQEKT